MATLNRTLLTSGAALVTASAIVAAPLMSPGAGMLAGAPTPAALSSAQYELTALSDITLQGINDAITNGYGGNLGPNDPYFPGVYNNATTVTGLNGALYYVLDKSGFVPFNLPAYYFEAGGVKAVAYVGITSLFGANSLAGQLAKSVFVDGTVTLQDAVVTLTAGIPVLGELTSVYVNGTVTGDTTNYGTGFAGVAAYVQAKYPAIAGLIGSLNLGGFGGHGESESDNDSEDGEHNGNGNGSNSSDSRHNEEDRTVAPAASARTVTLSVPSVTDAPAPVAPVTSVSSPQVTSVPAAVAAVSSPAPVVDNTPAADNTPAVAATPKRESARGAAGSAARAGAAAAHGAGARSANDATA